MCLLLVVGGGGGGPGWVEMQGCHCTPRCPCLKHSAKCWCSLRIHFGLGCSLLFGEDSVLMTVPQSFLRVAWKAIFNILQDGVELLWHRTVELLSAEMPSLNAGYPWIQSVPTRRKRKKKQHVASIRLAKSFERYCSSTHTYTSGQWNPFKLGWNRETQGCSYFWVSAN